MSAPGYLYLPGSIDDATIIPVAFDFTQSTLSPYCGESTITFTRAGATATRINSSGLIEVVAANAPRFDYDASTLACKGLLVEETRTNVQPNSIVDGTWTINAGGGTLNFGTAPDGTQTTFQTTAATANRWRGGAVVSGHTYTYSVFVKCADIDPLKIYIDGNFGASGAFASAAATWATPVSAPVLAGAATRALATKLKSGLYRLEVTFTALANGTANGYIFPSTANPQEWWGAQIEDGALASSYIPTAGATVTRNADFPQIATITPFYNTNEGAFFMEFQGLPGPSGSASNSRILCVAVGGQKTPLSYNSGPGPSITVGMWDNSVALGDGTYTTGAVGLLASTFKFNVGSAICLNGGTVASNATTFRFNDATFFNFGCGSGANNLVLNGYLRKFYYLPKQVANATLQAMTASGVTVRFNTVPVKARPQAAGLSEIPSDTPTGLRKFLTKLKETFEVRNAQLGSPLDANPTYRDLIDAGLIKVSDDVPLLASGREFTLDTKTWLTSNIPDWITDNTIPPVPTGFTVTANTSVITLRWTTPSFSNYKQTVIYRATSNNLSSAAIIGSNTGNTYVDDLPPAGTSYFYWIRHESKSELLSDFNSTNGTTAGNVATAPSVSFAFAGENLVLSWTTPTSNLAIQYFEVSYGASPGTTPVGISQSNSFRIKADFGGSRTYWVRAVDINFGLGTAGSASVTITSPGAPGLSQTLVGNSLAIAITGAPGSLPISYYDVRFGASFGAGTPLGLTSATRVEYEVNWTGSRTFWIAAVDSAGNVSSATSSTFNPALPTVTSVTAQVIDNNVLLRWTATTGVLPTKTYNVYRDATLIGTDAALFAAVFESTSGTYTYKIEPIDQAGNVGTFATTTATVQQPPDFVLYSNLQSSFSGTKTNGFLEASTGMYLTNVDTSETWTTHFSSRSWNTPQDQVNAGYTRFLVGKTTGSYLETVDYGTTIPSTKITMTPTTAFSDGTVTITPTLSTSPNNVTYTDFPGVFNTFSTSFRYVKFKMDFAATHNGTGLATDTSNLLGIKPLTYKLDVKLKTTQGLVTASSSDVGGTNVDITGIFIDVQAITLTPLSTTAKHPTYDFVDVPNPTNFKVYLWDAAGARTSGDVSYTVRGV